MSINKKSTNILLVCFLNLITIIPLSHAQADMGPKATMSFEFIFPENSSLTITEGQLLECSQPDCSDAQPLQQMGPQHFSCDLNTCSSMAYGYTEYNRLSITFSDGITRQSNIFGKKYFAAKYRVTVQQNSLMVEEQRGSLNPLVYLSVGIIVAGILGSAVILTLIILLILFVYKEGQEKTSFEQARALYIIAWVVGIPVVCLGVVLPISLPVTVGVEAGLMLLYALVRKRPPIKTLTVVLLMNLITLPFLWITMVQGNVNTFTWATLGGESLVVVVEALILYLTHRKTMPWLEAVALAFVINVVSFGIGLLLPVGQWIQ